VKLEPNKYYPITIESRFDFGDRIYPIKCCAKQDKNGSYFPFWYVGDSFILQSVCTDIDHEKIYLGVHKWGKENRNMALDVDAYHTLEDAAHQVELRNRHYIKEQ